MCCYGFACLYIGSSGEPVLLQLHSSEVRVAACKYVFICAPYTSFITKHALVITCVCSLIREAVRCRKTAQLFTGFNTLMMLHIMLLRVVSRRNTTSDVASGILTCGCI